MAKALLPAFMEAANILKVKGLIEEEANLEELQTKQAKNKSEDNSGEFEADNSDLTEPKNVDDDKFKGLEDEIDAVMKDAKTFDEEKEDSTLDDQEKVDEEDVVKLIETVVEEIGKDLETEGRHLSCELCSFVTAAKKRNSRSFAMKRHKIKAHGEKELLEKSLKVEEDDVVEEEEKLEGADEVGLVPSQDEKMDLSEDKEDFMPMLPQ